MYSSPIGFSSSMKSDPQDPATAWQGLTLKSASCFLWASWMWTIWMSSLFLPRIHVSSLWMLGTIFFPLGQTSAPFS